MTDPFRLRVLKALTEQIKTVTPTNGFTFDLATDVYRGRMYFGQNDPLPMVAILEPPTAVERINTQADNTGAEGEWDILIQGWADDDPDNPTDPAYALAAEVAKAIAEAKKQRRNGRTSDIFGMGAGLDDRLNGIENMRIGAPVVRPSDETSDKACFYMIVTFKIVEDIENPFG